MKAISNVTELPTQCSSAQMKQKEIGSKKIIEDSESDKSTQIESSTSIDSKKKIIQASNKGTGQKKGKAKEKAKTKEQEHVQDIFPSDQEMLHPIRKMIPIPQDYVFTDPQQYIKTMKNLEREKFLYPLRDALNKYVLKKENTANEEVQQISNKELEIFKPYDVVAVSLSNKDGLLIKVKIYKRIPKNKGYEMKGNQLIIFMNKENQQMHLGRTLQTTKKQPQINAELKNQLYNVDCDDASDDELDDNFDFGTDLVDITFEVQFDINKKIKDFLLHINDIESKYLLIHPGEYWYPTELTLNSIKYLSQTKQIAFPSETLYGKFQARFPKYSFLKSQADISRYIKILESTIKSKSNDLDPTQNTAFRHALYNDNAIIQGPPGTGKTFIGCEIINALLKNYSDFSKKPILVLSKKNKSLDVLLVKLSKFTNSILRMGSRITNDDVEQYTVKENNGPYRELKVSTQNWSDIIQNMTKLYQELKSKENPVPNQSIIVPDQIAKVLKQKLVNIFFRDMGINVENKDQLNSFSQSLMDLWLTESNFTVKKIQSSLNKCQIKLDDQQISKVEGYLKEQKLPYIKESNLDSIQLINLIQKVSTFSRFNFELRQIIKDQYLNNLGEKIQQRLFEYQKDYIKRKDQSDERYSAAMSSFMLKFKIIGMTVSGFQMNYQVFQKLKPEIVLVEEASEILETEFFQVLSPWLKHLIQIGDHQQLRPIVKSRVLQTKYNLEKSYFERLVSVNKADHVTLLCQRRMRTEFANITRLFYGPYYTDHSSVKKYEVIPYLNNNSTSMYMLQHTFPESDGGEKSCVNNFEALYAVSLAQELVEKEKFLPHQITIICMYSAQFTLVSNLIRFKHNLKNVEVSTVDKYQGQENDVIILSCVRSNKSNQIGFLSIDNRMNVAFSRARKGLFCLGNFQMYEQSCVMWEKINSVAKNQHSFCLNKVQNQFSEIYKTLLYTEKHFRTIQCVSCNKSFHLGYCDNQQNNQIESQK